MKQIKDEQVKVLLNILKDLTSSNLQTDLIIKGLVVTLETLPEVESKVVKPEELSETKA